MKRVLVLLIGEVLEDPRVYKTCVSLRKAGAEVFVACTNPSGRPENETNEHFTIIRFPHRRESWLKRAYHWLNSRTHPVVGSALGRSHDNIPSSPVKAALRNAAVGLNYRHFAQENTRINRMMTAELSSGNYDLVHVNDVDTLAAGCELKASGAAARLLYDSHEYWPGIGVYGSGPNDALRATEKRGIASADFVVTVNLIIARRMQNEYGLDKMPSVVMNCPYRYEGNVGMDTVNYPIRVIYQGKLQAFRGLDELVAAFRYMEGALLTLSGYGPLEESLKQLVKSLGLSDRVTFTGRYNAAETLPILSSHDIGVMPFRDVTDSIRMSSPNKLFDYTMAGLALAASDLPYLGAFIREHNAGKLFEEITPQSIAKTLNAMAAGKEELIRFKRNAHKAADTEYYWESQFRNYPWKP